MDYGHEWTDKELKKLERRISREYKQAAKEVQGKLDDYLKKFVEQDNAKKAELAAGKITEKEYKQWCENKIATGQRWAQLKAELSEDFHNANKITASMTRNFSYDAYAMNYNFGTYEVEKNTHLDTSFTLYDRSTVERLVRDNPQLLPPPGKRTARRIAEGKDKLWNQQQIQSVMLQSILQGEPIPKIADRLATAVGDSNKAAAVRNARTMTTGAENAGRVDSYKRAEKMGIKMEQMWVATLDDRTRYEHRQLDGMRVVVGEPFEIDGYTIRFPGDPQAEPEMVYNCRCTLIAAVAGTQIDQNEAKDLPRNSKLGDMTYEEWKGEKEKQDEGEPPAPIPEIPDEMQMQEQEEFIFEPASTIEEAEQFILQYMDFDQFGALREVNYKGIDIDVANEINKTISQLYTEFNVDKFGGIVAPAKNTKLGKAIDNAVAGYMPMRNSFVLNKTVLKSVKSAENSFADENKFIKDIFEHPEKYDFNKMSKQTRTVIENSKISGRATVPDNISEAINHEFGHALEKQVKKHKLWGNVQRDMEIYAPKISGYATTDKSEYIAESFASWKKGEEQADPNLIKIFENLKRRK